MSSGGSGGKQNRQPSVESGLQEAVEQDQQRSEEVTAPSDTETQRREDKLRDVVNEDQARSQEVTAESDTETQRREDRLRQVTNNTPETTTTTRRGRAGRVGAVDSGSDFEAPSADDLTTAAAGATVTALNADKIVGGAAVQAKDAVNEEYQAVRSEAREQYFSLPGVPNPQEAEAIEQEFYATAKQAPKVAADAYDAADLTDEPQLEGVKTGPPLGDLGFGGITGVGVNVPAKAVQTARLFRSEKGLSKIDDAYRAGNVADEAARGAAASGGGGGGGAVGALSAEEALQLGAAGAAGVGGAGVAASDSGEIPIPKEDFRNRGEVEPGDGRESELDPERVVDERSEIPVGNERMRDGGEIPVPENPERELRQLRSDAVVDSGVADDSSFGPMSPPGPSITNDETTVEELKDQQQRREFPTGGDAVVGNNENAGSDPEISEDEYTQPEVTQDDNVEFGDPVDTDVVSPTGSGSGSLVGPGAPSPPSSDPSIDSDVVTQPDVTNNDKTGPGTQPGDSTDVGPDYPGDIGVPDTTTGPATPPATIPETPPTSETGNPTEPGYPNEPAYETPTGDVTEGIGTSNPPGDPGRPSTPRVPGGGLPLLSFGGDSPRRGVGSTGRRTDVVRNPVASPKEFSTVGRTLGLDATADTPTLDDDFVKKKRSSGDELYDVFSAPGNARNPLKFDEE